jgi:hypothetical protein
MEQGILFNGINFSQDLLPAQPGCPASTTAQAITASAPAAFTLGTIQPGTPTIPSAAQALPADAGGKSPGPTSARTGTEFTAQGSVDGQPVPGVIVSDASWRLRRPWPAGAMRPRPAQQSTPG